MSVVYIMCVFEAGWPRVSITAHISIQKKIALLPSHFVYS